MSETLDAVMTYARFPFGLRQFLQQHLTLDKAQRIVQTRTEQRQDNFLRVLEQHIYGNPSSPYRTLLQWAGCELKDIRTMVRSRGLEETLQELRANGVYVTFEELKGRSLIVRNGRTLVVQPHDFDNPIQKRVFSTESSGSTGSPEQSGTDFSRMLARAPHQLLTKSAYGLLGTPEILWRGILPDSTFSSLLQRALIGQQVRHWFMHVGWRASKYWVKYDAATLYMLFWMRVFNTQTPFPEYVPIDQPQRIVHALAQALKADGKCSLLTMVSRALRVCLAARELGIDLTGVTILAGGEPPTPAKVRAIQQSGAQFYPNYAASGAGVIGNGCVRPIEEDDIHLFKDVHALITYPHLVEGFGVSVPAFHLTSLDLHADKIYLNAQMDDYGVVEERSCGCEFEKVGFTTHLREIRSFRKLTGEGVTLVGSDVLKILEELLPARFGGTPLDYQLQEQEDEKGMTRVLLVIHPRLGDIDEAQVIDVTLNALRQTSPMADAAHSVWRQTGSLGIKRSEPVWNARGKLMPLHIHPQSVHPHTTNSEPP